MHIAHLIDMLEIGGAEKLLVLFAEEAKARGIKVTIISLIPKKASDVIIADLESFGAHVIFLSIYKVYDPTALPKLLTVLRREKIDILQTHLQHSNILGVLAGSFLHIPVIGTLHSTNSRTSGKLSSLRISSERYLLRHVASRVVAVGRMIGEIYRDRLIDRNVDIVPNPVRRIPALSEDERNTIRREVAGNPKRFLILTVGRLRLEKGLQDLLIAFAQIHAQHPSTMLVVVGDGEILDELKSQAASLGLAESAHFTGARDDVPKLLAAGDMFVSSSYREGLSLAMLEAMAAGLPILATRVGDAEFLLKDGRGVMVTPHDVPALVNGISTLIENLQKMKEIGSAARTFVEANYSPSQWMERLLGIYEQARNNAN
jgi:glycosyltransferase involved in cell wall biosynthesis